MDDTKRESHNDAPKAEVMEGTEFNLAEGNQQLERGLKSRHIQFLALGMHVSSYNVIRIWDKERERLTVTC